MDENEAFAGLLISFEVSPTPVNSADPETPGLRIFQDGAVVYLPPSGAIAADAMTHELLHLRRYWNCGIPQLEPTNSAGQNWSITGQTENTLEHLVIASEEAELGIVRPEKFDREFRGNFQRIRQPGSHPDGNLRAGLMSWLASDRVADPDIRAFGRSTLAELGLWAPAQRFRRQALSLLHDKPRLIAVTVDAVKIPRSETRLAYFDIRHKAKRYAPIPA